MTSIDPETRRWVESATGSPMVSSVPLVGGMSSEIHRCYLANGRSVVVRHIADQEWLGREPDLIDRETRALELLQKSDVPAPEHLASDGPNGRLLMTDLPGRIRAGALHLCENIEAIADAAARIAAVDLPDDHGLAPWGSWAPSDPNPPTWGNDRIWQATIDTYLAREAPEADRRVLLHRDFHPLNLLWKREKIVGVVDWVNACVGHPHAELGHCRWNLAVMADQMTADRFLDRYLAVSDSGDYDRWWDLATAMSFISWPFGTAAWKAVGRTDITQARAVQTSEAFLTSALEHMRI